MKSSNCSAFRHSASATSKQFLVYSFSLMKERHALDPLGSEHIDRHSPDNAGRVKYLLKRYQHRLRSSGQIAEDLRSPFLRPTSIPCILAGCRKSSIESYG